MGPDEFWAKARAAGPWWMNGQGLIRTTKEYERGGSLGHCCPLGVPENSPAPQPWTDIAADKLGIPASVATRIAHGADVRDSIWRPLLLRELGLTKDGA